MSSYNFRSGNFTRGELEALYKQMSRRANSRLRSLERADRAFWAYDKATLYTQRAYGKNRFPTSPGKMSDKGLIRVLEEAQAFLNSQTSTVRGSKAVDKKIVDTFERKGIKISDKKEFFNFLDSSQFRSLSNKKIDSDRLIEFYTRSKEKGDSNQEIEDLLEEFRQGKIDGIDELYEKQGFNFLE